MILSQCALKLQLLISQQKPQSVTLSQLTKQARGDQKQECYKAFGSLSQIKYYIQKLEKELHLTQVLETTTQNDTTQLIAILSDNQSMSNTSIDNKTHQVDNMHVNLSQNNNQT